MGLKDCPCLGSPKGKARRSRTQRTRNAKPLHLQCSGARHAHDVPKMAPSQLNEFHPHTEHITIWQNEANSLSLRVVFECYYLAAIRGPGWRPLLLSLWRDHHL
jgi:hypothetical protein